MSETQSAVPEACGVLTGTITARPALPVDPAIERTRATWTSGDFGRIAVGYAPGAAAFVDRLALRRGETVLDVACGTGNLSLPAARRGATVTGLDIAPNLIDAARRASSAESLQARFDIGAAEALPYGDRSFDTVMSMFGVMFSAYPAQSLSEMVRVTRRGGRIAVASWTPGGFIGSMLRAHTALVPPPPGAPTPLGWGNATEMRQRIDAHRERIRGMAFTARTIALTYPAPPAAVVELFAKFYGPTVRTLAQLDVDGRAALRSELLRLWTAANRATDGSTTVSAEYLEARLEIA